MVSLGMDLKATHEAQLGRSPELQQSCCLILMATGGGTSFCFYRRAQVTRHQIWRVSGTFRTIPPLS